MLSLRLKLLTIEVGRKEDVGSDIVANPEPGSEIRCLLSPGSGMNNADHIS